MRMRVAIGLFLGFAISATLVTGQGSAPANLNPQTGNASAEEQPTGSGHRVAEKKQTQKSKEPALKATSEEQIVTEIYADQTVFDSAKSIGVFTGHVVVTDPRFNIQGDKLTVFISKEQNEGFEKAIVEGNVGVVRDRPNPNGGPPDHMVGRADKAVYTAKDGRFELTGNPRVQQGLNTHVATSPETVMILNESGQLETHGPSRTEIRQDPNGESPAPKP